MASKFKLVPEPTFKCKVLIPRAGQESGEIELTYKHHIFSELTNLEKELEGKPMIELIIKLVSSWNLDDGFNKDNMQVLLDNYPAAGVAILDTFYKEILGKREKNS